MGGGGGVSVCWVGRGFGGKRSEAGCERRAAAMRRSLLGGGGGGGGGRAALGREVLERGGSDSKQETGRETEGN